MKKYIILIISVLSINLQFSCTAKKDPYFQMRGIVLSVEDLATVDWPKLAYENGINTIGTHVFPEQVATFIQSGKGIKFLADCKKYGIEVEHQLHSIGELLPRSLYAEDSTMFRMNESGQRTDDYNLCVHSQKALDIIASNALRYAKLLPPTNHRYYFWIDDGQPMCHCPECAQYSDSEQSLIVENRMIRELRTFDPDAQLAHLAYHGSLSAPRKVKPAEGIFLEFAPIERSWEKPLAEHAPNDGRDSKFLKGVTHLQYLKDNLEVFPVETAVVLEYWLDVSIFSKWKKPAVKLPWNKSVFDADIKTYGELGIRNITTFAVYIDDKYIETYKDLGFLKEYGFGLMNYSKK